ncbi:MAG: SPOR domain-containing protein [Desulfobacterales bacterium]
MLTFFKRRLCALLTAALILLPLTVHSETVVIPVFLTYAQLRHLIVQEMFKGPGHTARYALDDSGCAVVTYSEPRFSAEGQLLRVEVDTLATIGMPTTDGCATLGQWTGRSVVRGVPELTGARPLSAGFKVQTLELYDDQGRRLTDLPALQTSDEQLRQSLSTLKIDLKPEVERLTEWLPSVLPRYSADRLTAMVDSLRIGHIRIRPEGLDLGLTIDVAEIPQEAREPALSAIELAQLELACRQWDAFLTFVVKQAAIATSSEALRLALMEILLDARYEIRAALVENTDRNGADPVKVLFVRSWQRLEPVMRQITAQSPAQNTVPFLSFMTAADALVALEKLGPAAGLDISADGLRRLARLLNDNPNLDPLQFVDGIDPELQKLFDFGIPETGGTDKKPLGFNLGLVRPAYAASARDRLNHWVPRTDELGLYLNEVRHLLQEKADARIRAAAITNEHAGVFRKLMLAAAWQESCWRQYVIQKNKIVPLVSGSGDVGLLQINERVWRGFYAGDKLRWDIDYNARAGSEILFKFMVDYALKQQEHKQPGGLSNLARAAYSAYNGGPSQVSRYRGGKVPAAHKKIDTAFWAKYQRVERGEEMAVVECLGGEAAVSAENSPPASRSQADAGATPQAAGGKPARIENSHWISKQKPGHFTLQLAALSSEEAARDLVEQQVLPGIFAYCRLQQEGRVVYSVIYGSFTNRADAQKSAARFALLNPWIREFGSIQKAMAK